MQVEGSLEFLDPKTLLKKTEGFQAPDIVGLDNWINSEPIESLEELKGKVVMIDFWTLGCINCINTHKETNLLYDEFRDQGLEILGLHAPEFAYERKIENVRKAVIDFEMEFPVATDNDFATWRAYNNRYWPAFYIIDKSGNIRYTHFGEGGYEKKREVIKELLAESEAASLLGGENGEGFEQAFLTRSNLRTNTAVISIPIDEVLSGGPTKDGIPAINAPEFVSQRVAERDMPYLLNGSQGIVLDIDGIQRYYSYDVLVWHEIVNDEIRGQKVAVTFCPLCGSAIVYDRNVNGREVNFGVSGRLYNSNLLMYDTHDESLWSQSLGEAVVGDQTGTKLQVVKSHLMSYEEFKENFPDGKVITDESSGFYRQYGTVPYGDYDDNDDLFFPVNADIDDIFGLKELFYIVNDGDESLAFHWDDLRAEGQAEIQIGTNTYRASFNNGLADVMKDGENLPGYYEMWFSWQSHNEGNKNIWSK